MVKKGAVVVFLALMLGVGGAAQAQLGLMGIGGKIGLVSAEEDIGSTLGLGVQAKLGKVAGLIGLDAFVDFWTKNYDAGFGTDASFREIAIGAVGKYYIPFQGSPVKPYAGAGLALNIGRAKVEWSIPYFGSGSESKTETDIGLHLVAGAEMGLSPSLTGFAEAKYAIDGADYFALMAGVIFNLPE
ncbi:MAG: porin family protein [candidate division KSB1 bacterium]|nr:porin family protein [candidate division KSB1 bacterium]